MRSIFFTTFFADQRKAGSLKQHGVDKSEYWENFAVTFFTTLDLVSEQDVGDVIRSGRPWTTGAREYTRVLVFLAR